MDALSNVRSLFLLLIIIIDFGNNLYHYLNSLFLNNIFVSIHRAIRIYRKYLIDYCYIGNILLIYFNLFSRKIILIF